MQSEELKPVLFKWESSQLNMPGKYTTLLLIFWATDVLQNWEKKESLLKNEYIWTALFKT